MISADTYEELYEILSLMDKTTVMKVPIDILNTIKEQRNPEYQTRIDRNDIFNENNVKKETVDLLCYLDYHYWMDESKKAEVDRIRKEMLQEEENKKREQYNPNNLFKKEQILKNDLNTSLTEYKESLFVKLKNFIFKILHINK
jgi:hypothetical protein